MKQAEFLKEYLSRKSLTLTEALEKFPRCTEKLLTQTGDKRPEKVFIETEGTTDDPDAMVWVWLGYTTTVAMWCAPPYVSPRHRWKRK